MQPLPTYKFVLRRLIDDWKLLLSIFSGILIASTLVAGAPVYLNSLERLSLNTAIDRSSDVFLNMLVFSPNIPLEEGTLQRTDQAVEDALLGSMPEVYLSKERYLKAPVMLVGTPQQLLSSQDRVLISRGYFQSLTNIGDHVTFEAGRMSSDEVRQGERGPVVEAIIGTVSATVFAVGAGDEVVITPSLDDPKRITVEIVGVMEPRDPTEEYWQQSANIFIEPAPLNELPDVGIEVDPEEPPLAMFVTQKAMQDSIGVAYPGTLLSSTWFIFIDKEPLKKIPRESLSSRVTNVENAISEEMSGSAVFTGIKALLGRFERRSFFSSIPLLLLLTIMVMTVLYYLAMMVSYLVNSRETDVALLRSRGVSTMQLVRLYAFEGLILTILATIIAPFLAMSIIALSGKLPNFTDITNSQLLPVEFQWTPFFVAIIIGIISLAIFVIPGVIGARTGLIIHKLRSSRPPTVPLFQRYYLDVLLLVFGGLVFWELNARGQLVSGGLFKDIQVNEALLFAPVLVLTLVALVFMRFFPLFVRFIGGESQGLTHLLVIASTVSLIAALIIIGFRADDILSQSLPVILVIAIAGVYRATDGAGRPRTLIYGLGVQAALVIIVMLLRLPVAGTISFLPSIGLILIVPAQLLFLGFKGLSRVAPVWISMGLWHMARNPLQYSWLVLLLVMVTGLGVLATTVGGTLGRSYEERVRYDVVADLRITDIPSYIATGTEALKERYASIPGVTSVSLGLRDRGRLGANFTGRQFGVLAVDSEEFHRISWYRDDFSDRPLPQIMAALRPSSVTKPVEIPEGAVSIGVWAKPEVPYENMFLWMIIQDSLGTADTVTLGNIGGTDWTLMTSRMPRGLVPPLQLASIQIFEPVFGPVGTPGFIMLDDIHVITDSGDIVILEDFEDDQTAWLPLATSVLSTDSVSPTESDVFKGDRSAIFRFGKDTDRGVRGFYQSPNGGPLRIVASTSFMQATGARIREPIIIDLLGRFVPVEVWDSVDYFPTMNPRGSGFIIADLDSLLRHLNLLNPGSKIGPNELYIKEAPGAGESVSEAMSRLVGRDLVRDRDAQLEEIRLDPLITAGWKAMVLLAIAIIILAATLGYVTYLLAFADRSRSEMGFLQSLGLSRRQLIGLLALEHLVIVVIGLVLGTITGWVMSDLMVQSIAVTENGAQVLPPFILQTDLRLLIPIYIALILIFLASVYRLTRSMINVDLHAVSRMEGA